MMTTENIIRIVLLILGSMIILAILWDGLRRKKQRLFDENTIDSMNDDIDFDAVKTDVKTLTLNLPNIGKTEFVLTDEAIEEPKIIDVHEEDTPEEPEAILIKEENNSVEEKQEPIKEPIKKDVSDRPNQFISIRIQARPGRLFSGYALLQTLLANKMDYGDKQLFHRYQDSQKKKKLFSLASIDEPGDFNLSKMGEFASTGLILYMNTAEHKEAMKVFEQMLETAEDLVSDLNGILMSGDKQLWTDETTSKILEYLNQ